MSRSFTRTGHFSSGDSFGSRGAGGACVPRKGLWLWATDLGLLATILVVPFVMGGRQPLGQLVFGLLVCATAGCWAMGRVFGRTSSSPRGPGAGAGWRWSGAEPLLLAGLAICLVQTVSLPPEYVEEISPHLGEMLPLWEAAGTESAGEALVPGPWTTLSLTPARTRSSLGTLAAAVLLFVIVVQRIESPADARRLLKALCLCGVLMALFGVVQMLTSNGKFFWCYEHPHTHTRYFAKGAFTNKNHFASFLGMCLPLLTWWLVVRSAGESRRDPYASDRSTRWAPAMLLTGLAIVALGILLSQSRGGLIAASAGMLVTLGLLWRMGRLTGRVAGLVGTVGLAAIVSLMFFGENVERLVDRSFRDLTSADIEQLDRSAGRRRIWQAVLSGIRDYPLLGTGLSSHRDVYPTYFDHPDEDLEYTHAENGYLQVALESGLVGLSVAGLLILCVLLWCRRGIRAASGTDDAAALAAIAGAVAVNLVHSVSDFVWYVPACMIVFIVASACAARLSRLTDGSSPTAERGRDRPPRAAGKHQPSPRGAPVSVMGRLAWLASLAGIWALGSWLIRTKSPEIAAEKHWHEYVRLARFDSGSGVIEPGELKRQMLSTLLAAARANPEDGRLQVRAAFAYRTQFDLRQAESEGRMPLTQIREAARATEFESAAERNEWLNRPGVIGEDRKLLDASMASARRAIALCPLHAAGYLTLAELGWLRGIPPQEEAALLRQALLVRPYDAEVHFAIGREGWRRGETESALACWRRAFRRDADYQQKIIDVLAPVLPARFLLENFDPDAEALLRIRTAYAESSDVDGYRRVSELLARRLAEQAHGSAGPEAADLWCRAHDLYRELEDERGAIRTAEAAVAAHPGSMAARLRLADWLFTHGYYSQAREHLTWCARRRPDDEALKQRVVIAARESGGR